MESFAGLLHVDEEASRLSLKLGESCTYSDGIEMQMILAILNLLGQVFYIPNILNKCGCRSKRRKDKSGGQRGKNHARETKNIQKFYIYTLQKE